MSVLDVLDTGDEIAALMRPLYLLVLAQAGEDVSLALGIDDVFYLDMPQVQRILGDLVIAIKDVTDTTKDEVRGLIAQQAANGWSDTDLADAIRAMGLERSKTRAETIAVTATAEAYSRGSMLAYRESGVVRGTEWLVADTPCSVCEEFAAKGVVALGEDYGKGIQHPPAHPRCRCSLSPVLTER